MGNRGYFPGGKMAMGLGCRNIYISAEVKDEWSYILCMPSQHAKEQLYLYFHANMIFQ
jgi:hypothetical protein